MLLCSWQLSIINKLSNELNRHKELRVKTLPSDQKAGVKLEANP